jgi:ABC-2 type transport system ATP-binding protein
MVIQIENLYFAYKRGKPLFEGLNLALQPGYVYGLLGRNGAGKSSLLRLMSGLLFPQQGECRVGGVSASRRSPDFLREVFFVPEEFELPPISIRGYVRINAPFYPKFDHAQFDNYLEEFELVETQRMTELSFGQKKKVFTGFGLAANTSLLILDEPTNGLDIPAKVQFRRLLAAASDPNRVIVVSTHQVRDLENLIDPVIILNKNKILLNASMERISEKLEFTALADLAEARRSVLYSEPSVRGHAVVMPSNGERHSKVDLELLFNTALQQPEAIREIFEG